MNQEAAIIVILEMLLEYPLGILHIPKISDSN